MKYGEINNYLLFKNIIHSKDKYIVNKVLMKTETITIIKKFDLVVVVVVVVNYKI
jgi:hypothetical protein